MKVFSKKRMVILVLFLSIVAIGISVIAMSLGDLRPKQSQKKVAVVTKSTTSEFWQAVKRGVETAAAEFNVSFTFTGPDNEEDVGKQNELIRATVAGKADLIVLSGISYTGSTKEVEKAVNKGIPVIVIDSDIESKLVSLRIMTDSVEAGKKAALHAVSLAKPDTEIIVGLVNYDIASENGQQRERGTREQLVEINATYERTNGKEGRKIKIYDTKNVVSTVDSAQQGFTQLLEKHPDINTVITYNELTTLGVGFAARKLGLGEKINIIGFDNNVECVNMLETGVIDALVVQNPFAMGYLSIESANKMIQNKRYNADKLIKTEVGVITRDNMFASENQKLLFPLK